MFHDGFESESLGASWPTYELQASRSETAAAFSGYRVMLTIHTSFPGM
jgi:hypothetical protein